MTGILLLLCLKIVIMSNDCKRSCDEDQNSMKLEFRFLDKSDDEDIGNIDTNKSEDDELVLNEIDCKTSTVKERKDQKFFKGNHWNSKRSFDLKKVEDDERKGLKLNKREMLWQMQSLEHIDEYKSTRSKNQSNETIVSDKINMELFEVNEDKIITDEDGESVERQALVDKNLKSEEDSEKQKLSVLTPLGKLKRLVLRFFQRD
ncbi:hypothetical protein DMUE_2508 [Dictyocoela muelleri]|nr:hypothetical protein DMUE_2508 [Dictyocoela muelleri]